MNAPVEIDTIGKYELIREIGFGSMGRVYLARDAFAQRDFAIKIAEKPETETERGARRRRKLFFNEVRAAGILHHPNIVATVDAGVDEGRRYIVMEYVPGARTLADFAKPDRLMPIAQVVKIMQQCAMAFDYAHSKGVVHRDIKPTNIMLDERDEVKIGDFGVALIDRIDVEETQVVGRLGSPRYMSPEQLMATEVNNQSDIFSLGVVIYELLTGVSPFAGKHVGEIARKILKEAQRPIRELREEIPERLAAIVDRTLKKHPAGRYRTAMELAGDLGLIYDHLEYSGLRRAGPDAVRMLEQLDTFYGFEIADISEVLAVAIWEDVGEGAAVCREGEGEPEAVILVRGRVEVCSGGVRIAQLEAGASFGDFGLVESGALGAEIRALEPCTVLRIGSGQIGGFSSDCRQRLYRVLAAGYAGRLQHLQRRINRRAARRTE